MGRMRVLVCVVIGVIRSDMSVGSAPAMSVGSAQAPMAIREGHPAMSVGSAQAPMAWLPSKHATYNNSSSHKRTEGKVCE